MESFKRFKKVISSRRKRNERLQSSCTNAVTWSYFHFTCCILNHVANPTKATKATDGRLWFVSGNGRVDGSTDRNWQNEKERTCWCSVIPFYLAIQRVCTVLLRNGSLELLHECSCEAGCRPIQNGFAPVHRNCDELALPGRCTSDLSHQPNKKIKNTRRGQRWERERQP